MEILSAFFGGNASDSADLATWNRPRSTEELQQFINSHHDMLPDNIEIE
jgi:hypothetical protein